MAEVGASLAAISELLQRSAELVLPAAAPPGIGNDGERFDFEHVQQQMKNIAKHALLSVQGKVAKSRPIEVR